MDFLPFANMNKRIHSFSFIEVMVSIGLLSLLITPFFAFSTQLFSSVQSDFCQIDSAFNVEFILNSIQDEINLITFCESDFLPKNQTDSNLLSYRHPNGKIVRYYKVGDELVKDFNYSGYNAITPKIISFFQVRRVDYPGYICLLITVHDKEGYVYHRKINKKISL